MPLAPGFPGCAREEKFRSSEEASELRPVAVVWAHPFHGTQIPLPQRMTHAGSLLILQMTSTLWVFIFSSENTSQVFVRANDGRRKRVRVKWWL